MAKKKQQVAPEPAVEVETTPDSLPIEETPEHHPSYYLNWRKVSAIGIGVILLLAALLIGYERIYAGKVVPGVSVAGAYIGGMNKAEAVKAVESRVAKFKGQQFTLAYGKTFLRFPVTSLQYDFDTEMAVDVALEYGRKGSFAQQIKARLRSLMSRSTNVAVYSYDKQKLTGYISEISTDLDKPVSNAQLKFVKGKITVQAGKSGQRVDIGLVTKDIEDYLSKANTAQLDAHRYEIEPAIDSSSLGAAKHQAEKFLEGKLTLKVQGATHTVDIPRIISWIKISTPHAQNFNALSLDEFAPRVSKDVRLEISKDAVAGYVRGIAKTTDQEGQDAALTIEEGRATVFKPSRDGYKLDQPGSVSAIMAALTKPADDRELTLAVAVKKPTVTEDSLNDLGIKELISEGVTYFPGSPYTRLINIRVGQARYNGILLKPGETFSFGKILGDVGPAQGYVPELVILSGRVEKQYGGGLCQVSSTAYRAALLAGLPITERHNHSYAVSYYTAPFGVPGVDATIYYPAVDFKFVNDTGHHLLIQTIMEGTTLKFQYYGTKKKSGRIRGPYFVSGSNDAHKPSHTVFYRDVLDLNGKVLKTDTVHTWYKSKDDFPITSQFN